MNRQRRLLLAALLIVGVTGCDQATKFSAVAHLTDVMAEMTSSTGSLDAFLTTVHPRATAPISVIEGFWDLRYVENPGAAFSSFQAFPPGLARFALTAVSIVVLGFLFRWLWKEASGWRTAALALIAGGAIGNLIDRVRLGYVIDFIHWHWREQFDWPVFNMADAAISAGVLLLIAGVYSRQLTGSVRAVARVMRIR